MKPKKKSTRPSAKTARSPARPRRRPKAAPDTRAHGTELRRVQEALQARTAELETLMREAPMPIFVGHDAACRVITDEDGHRRFPHQRFEFRRARLQRLLHAPQFGPIRACIGRGLGPTSRARRGAGGLGGRARTFFLRLHVGAGQRLPSRRECRAA